MEKSGSSSRQGALAQHPSGRKVRRQSEINNAEADVSNESGVLQEELLPSQSERPFRQQRVFFAASIVFLALGLCKG